MNRSANSQQVLRVLNIAFYRFVELTELLEHQRLFREICSHLKLRGTILLSPEGMNGSLAGDELDVREFQKFLSQNPVWMDLEFKESYSHHIPYTRMMVKVKKEIIPLGDAEVQPGRFTVPRITPQDLKKWLDENREFDLVDTRNEYEIQHGTFKKAIHLGLRHFRKLPGKMGLLPEESKSRPLVMFCTGGIRCEKAGVVAMRHGFKEVFQLDGGILKYFEECGESHYRGNCFVFDERIAVDPQLKALKDEDVQEGNV